uniref:Uncharacterized protein n=1 Tax=Mycena chlorophos TaxID=658473 RepID=A0ABQ0LPN1_MYCCL|nr:predicted protein [Mycena chlorophos]
MLLLDPAQAEVELSGGYAPFARITHLDLFGNFPTSLIPHLGLFPALTHLSLTDFFELGFVQATLRCYASLQVLFVVWTNSDDSDDADTDGDDADLERRVADPRFCILKCADFAADWVRSARGGVDLWTRAENRTRLRVLAQRIRWEAELQRFDLNPEKPQARYIPMPHF